MTTTELLQKKRADGGGGWGGVEGVGEGERERDTPTTVYAKIKNKNKKTIHNISVHPRYFSYRYSIFINPIPQIYPLECILLEKFVPLSYQDLCLYTLYVITITHFERTLTNCERGSQRILYRELISSWHSKKLWKWNKTKNCMKKLHANDNRPCQVPLILIDILYTCTGVQLISS